MKTTKKHIESVFKMLCEEASLPMSKQQAIDEGKTQYCTFEYASNYGGYRLMMVNVEGGGHWGAFNESSMIPRVKAGEFYNKLNLMYNTLVWAKQQKA